MGATTNMVKGFIWLGLYVVGTIIIPYTIFTYIYSLTSSVQDYVYLGLTQEKYEQITFWIFALGFLICGLAFLAHSSPKKSVRRGAFKVVLVFFNCLYIWIYAISNVTLINIVIMDVIIFTVDLTNLFMFFMGIYFLSIIVHVLNLLNYTFYKQ